jgi:hypothetical protein
VVVGVAVGGGVSVGGSVAVGSGEGDGVGSAVLVVPISAIDVASIWSGDVVGVVVVHAIRRDNSSNITNNDTNFFDMNTVISFFSFK